MVEHKLHGGQFERSGFALVGAEHAIARCFEALLQPELSVCSVNDPHAAAVDGRLVKCDPIGTDGVQFVDAKIVVVLVPVDRATGMRRFAQALAEDQFDIRPYWSSKSVWASWPWRILLSRSAVRSASRHSP